MSIEFAPAFDRISVARASGPSEIPDLKAEISYPNRRFADRESPGSSPQISARRLAANRRNARRSTGPRTPEGKQRSSRNALKHGLRCALSVRLPSECSATYNIFIEELRDELRPRGVIEIHLFNQICAVLWRLNRLPEAQRDLFPLELDRCADGETLAPSHVLARRFSEAPTQNPFLLLERYERSLRNQFLRLLSQFHRHRRERAAEISRRDDELPPREPERAWTPEKQRAQEAWFHTPEGIEHLERIKAAEQAPTESEKSNPIEPSKILAPDAESAIEPDSARSAGAERTHFDLPAGPCELPVPRLGCADGSRPSARGKDVRCDMSMAAQKSESASAPAGKAPGGGKSPAAGGAAQAGYDVARPMGKCHLTGETISPGDQFMAALRETAAGFERLDISMPAWPQFDRAGVLAFWQTVMPAQEQKKKLFVDDEVLCDLFERLKETEEPAKLNFRFVLGLILMRKKMLIYDTSRTEDDKDIWVLHFKGREDKLDLLNPRLDEAQVAEVSKQLGQILNEEL